MLPEPANPYLEVARQLMDLASEAHSPQAREQFVLLAAMYQNLARSARRMDWAPLPPPISLDRGVMYSSWRGSFLQFRRDTVLASAPSGPGVYALWSPTQWVYVGESADVRARLLAHLDGDEQCISAHVPSGFGVEFIEAHDRRLSRLQTLIRELAPACNPACG